MVRRIIFDFDGVLISGTNQGYFRCYHQAALDVGADISFELARSRILRNWGKSVRTEVTGMIPEHPELVDRICARYEELLETQLFVTRAAPIPGARETLKWCREHEIGVSVVSGMKQSLLDSLAAKYEFNSVVDELISTIESDDPLRQKASGFHVRLLMEKHKLDYHELICVGDAPSDIEMSSNAGIDVLVVLTGILNRRAALNLGVKHVLTDVTQLPAWLRQAQQTAVENPNRSPKFWPDGGHITSASEKQ